MFSDVNRLGVPGSLHRISAMKDRQGVVYGLTYRVGRHVLGEQTVSNPGLLSGWQVSDALQAYCGCLHESLSCTWGAAQVAVAHLQLSCRSVVAAVHHIQWHQTPELAHPDAVPACFALPCRKHPANRQVLLTCWLMCSAACGLRYEAPTTTATPAAWCPASPHSQPRACCCWAGPVSGESDQCCQYVRAAHDVGC